MTTVGEAGWQVLTAHGIDTVFGNPGSNELPFLAAMPDGVRYVLGLHEGAVLGMAEDLYWSSSASRVRLDLLLRLRCPLPC